jgi:hypothetical protein
MSVILQGFDSGIVTQGYGDPSLLFGSGGVRSGGTAPAALYSFITVAGGMRIGGTGVTIFWGSTIGTGGAVVSGASLRSWFNTASGGVETGGYGHLIFDESFHCNEGVSCRHGSDSGRACRTWGYFYPKVSGGVRRTRKAGAYVAAVTMCQLSLKSERN